MGYAVILSWRKLSWLLFFKIIFNIRALQLLAPGPQDQLDPPQVVRFRPDRLRQPASQEMDMFEQQEMSKSRSQVTSKLNDWYDWLVNHVPKAIKDNASGAFKTFKDKIMGLYNRVNGNQTQQNKIEKLKRPRKPIKLHEPEESFNPIELEQAFNGAYRSYRINGRPRMNVDTFFDWIRQNPIDLINKELAQLGSARVQTTTWIRYVQGHMNAEINIVERAFNSRMTEVHRGDDLDEIVDGMIAYMKTQIKNPALLRSVFRFDELLRLDINFHQLNLTRASSYLPLPDRLARKKAIISPKNENDEECSKYSIIAVLHHKEIKFNPERISNLIKFEDNYDWTGLDFSTRIDGFREFEKKNNIGIHVLGINEKDIYILRRCNYRPGQKVAILLPITDGEKRHYTAVKSLSRLLRSSNSKHKCKQHFCLIFLQGFGLEESRDKHLEYCLDNEAVKVEMPPENLFVEFHDGQYQFKVPYAMYADFESILQPMEETIINPEGSYTKDIRKHIPSGFCIYSKLAYGEVRNPLKLYRGEDCVEKFCDHIKEEARRLYHMFPEKPMEPLTNKQWKRYKRASKCHICYKPFEDKNAKVRDHCHYTGKYRGPTHMLCNLRYKVPSYILVILHNLSGYDAHLFIRELGKKTDDIGVIAKNKEDYITFLVNVMVDKYKDKKGNEKDKTIELRFINNFKFMASSLDSLTNNLVKGGRKLIGFEDYSEEQYMLLVRKKIYPYEYMSSWDKFTESQLPPKKAFCSNLNMSNVSDDDYQHVQKVWSTFSIRDLGEYHDLCLKTDVILLANVFEAFRDTCLEHYKLDPAHFYTSPCLAWKACLKKTGVRLELLTDPDMLLMFERGIRDGITQAVHGYAKTNNEYMGDKIRSKRVH